MNSAHDLGGRHGFGPIAPEAENSEPVFHEDWERKALALVLAAGSLGQWNLDESRFSRESQHPVDYLRQSYYENWLSGLEKLLVEKGLVTEEELSSGRAFSKAEEELQKRVLKPEKVYSTIEKGGSTQMESDEPPEFNIGDRVRAKNRHPLTHTREPGYSRGREGIIEAHYGAHVMPDQNALGNRIGEHLYCVRFDAGELWGKETSSKHLVFIDLWESYLERA